MLIWYCLVFSSSEWDVLTYLVTGNPKGHRSLTIVHLDSGQVLSEKIVGYFLYLHPLYTQLFWLIQKRDSKPLYGRPDSSGIRDLRRAHHCSIEAIEATDRAYRVNMHPFSWHFLV
jgi:hypothetical protein